MAEANKTESWMTRPSELIKIAGVLIAIGFTLQQMRATASIVHDLQMNQQQFEVWRAQHQAAQDASANAEALRIREEIRRIRDEDAGRRR